MRNVLRFSGKSINPLSIPEHLLAGIELADLIRVSADLNRLGIRKFHGRLTLSIAYSVGKDLK